MPKDALVSDDLAKKFAAEKETPYTKWVRAEGLDIISSFYVPDLHTVDLKPWASRGGRGVFLNHDASRTSNDCYVCEIPAGRELAARRQLFEEMIYVLDGRGSTAVWNDAGQKITFEWKAGALFAVPLNTWHQHFNAQGNAPVRMISLTDAPVIVNRYRNLDYIFNNSFIFSDRYSGGADEWGKGGRYIPEVKRGRVWESNFIADLWGFQPKDYKERGGDNRTTLFEFVDNTMSAHLSEFPVGKYKKAHRHGAGAHIVMLTGAGYSYLWPEGEYDNKRRVEWGRMSMFVPPMQWWHQHFNPGPEPARYLALKPWGFKFNVEDLKDTGEDVKKGGAQIEYEDQNPEIHRIFLSECGRRGAEARMPMFGT